MVQKDVSRCQCTESYHCMGCGEHRTKLRHRVQFRSYLCLSHSGYLWLRTGGRGSLPRLCELVS